MSVIEPSSTIHICSVPMKMGNPNQLIFSTKAEQDAYFANASDLRTVEDCTYIRKDGVLRVPINIERIRRDNYVYYTNEHYSDKVFYAFIESMEYANDNTTFVRIKTDYWQTYMFDIRYRPVFIERETVGSDNVGEHTYPEGLELGEFVTNGGIQRHRICRPASAMTVIAVSDITPLNRPYDPSFSGDVLNFYNGVYSGLTYLAFDPYDGISIQKFLDWYANAAHGSSSDAIVYMFTAPQVMLDPKLVVDTASIPDCTFYWIRGAQNGYDFTPITLDKPTQVDGFTPKNKKLLTAPFCFFNLSNNAGSMAEFHYEDFASTPSFDIEGALSVGCSIKAHPRNYKNASDPYSYGVIGPKLPVCAWVTDVYTNWLTQNALNIENTQVFGAISALNSGANAAKSGSASGFAGSALNYAETVSNLASEQYQHSVQPPQANGDCCSGDITFANGQCAFTFYPMCVRAEIARKIDEYFSMYGYKINRVKRPQLFTRRYWNFVKTVGCLFEGKVPNEALDELTAMFDAGITFWHDPEQFGQYGNTNSIV